MAHHTLGDATTSDFIVVAEHKEIHVHRAVLTRTSPFLNSFLTEDPTCTRINANNAKYEAMMIVLSIMYAAGTPMAATVASVNGPSSAFANNRYDFSIILSAWEIGMHFRLTEIALSAAGLLLPLLSKYTSVRALRSCLKHPKDSGASRIRDVAGTFLPPLLDTEDQRADWRILREKYPIVVQLAADQEDKARRIQEERAREEEQARELLAKQREELQREREQSRIEIERERRELSQHQATSMNAFAQPMQVYGAVPASANTSQMQFPQPPFVAGYQQPTLVAAYHYHQQPTYQPSPVAPQSMANHHWSQSRDPTPSTSPFQMRNAVQSSYDGLNPHPQPPAAQPNRLSFDDRSVNTIPDVADQPIKNSSALRLRNGSSLSPPRSAAQAAEMAQLQQQLAALKDLYQRQQEEQRHEEEHLQTLASDLDSHDVDINEVKQELVQVTKEVDAAVLERARLEEEQEAFTAAIKENEEYVRNARVYIPAAHEAASFLASNIDAIMRSTAANSKANPRELLKGLLADLRKDKTSTSAELQEAQKVGSGLKHHIQMEKDKTDGITDQLLALRAAS